MLNFRQIWQPFGTLKLVLSAVFSVHLAMLKCAVRWPLVKKIIFALCDRVRLPQRWSFRLRRADWSVYLFAWGCRTTLWPLSWPMDFGGWIRVSRSMFSHLMICHLSHLLFNLSLKIIIIFSSRVIFYGLLLVHIYCFQIRFQIVMFSIPWNIFAIHFSNIEDELRTSWMFAYFNIDPLETYVSLSDAYFT